MSATLPTGRLSGWAHRTAGGLPRPFWVIWSGTFVNRLGFFVEPFLALYLVRARDLSVPTAGAVVTALGAGSVVSQPVGGWAADRLGRRATLVGGLVACSVAMLGLGAARSLPQIVAAALVTGLTLDVYRPAASAAVADLVPPERRPAAYALTYWAYTLGVGVSAVLGGVLAEHGYWLLFVLDAATCAAFAVIIAKGLPETRPPRAAGPARDGGYRVVVADRLLLALTLATFAGAVVYLQSLVTLPLAMRQDGLGPSAYGMAYSINPILVLVVSPLSLPLLVRLPPTPLYAAAATLLGIGFGLTAFARSTPGYLLTIAVWTLGEIGTNAVAPSLVAAIAPAHLRGRYNGMIGLAFGGAAVVAPVVGTAVLASLGRGALWGSCLLLSMAAAAMLLALGPALARRTSPLP